MENQDSEYRKAMIDMMKYVPKEQEATICFTCVGFKSFGGKETKDVTKGPMCICTDTWEKVHAHITKMKAKKLFTI